MFLSAQPPAGYDSQLVFAKINHFAGVTKQGGNVRAYKHFPFPRSNYQGRTASGGYYFIFFLWIMAKPYAPSSKGRIFVTAFSKSPS